MFSQENLRFTSILHSTNNRQMKETNEYRLIIKLSIRYDKETFTIRTKIRR